MAAKLGKEAIALILAEAEFTTDETVAAKYGINRRSISRYRAKLSEDPELSQLVSKIKKELVDEWQASIVKALFLVLRQIEHTVSTRTAVDREKPSEWLHSLAGVAKILGELMLESKLLSQPVERL